MTAQKVPLFSEIVEERFDAVRRHIFQLEQEAEAERGLQLEDMPSHRIEPLFDNLTEKRSFLSGQCRVNLSPVLRLQGLDGGRKEIALFHGDMGSFVHDEIANDVIDGVPQHFTIGQRTVDRLHDPAQTFGPLRCSAARSPN